MCTSSAVRYFISTSGSRPPSLIFHSPWRRPVLKFVPLCCLMQKICVFRWSFTYIPSVMWGFKCLRFPIRHCDFRLKTHRIIHRAMLLSAAVTSASSKTNVATFNLLPKVIYALWFNGHQVCQIFTKNHPQLLHFRWRNSKTGWTISKISTSFRQALMALGIRRSATENSDGQLRYF